MDRVAIRINRFEDQDAYRRVLDLFCGLYPDRPSSDFEHALARLPCLVSHDADTVAAEALRAALEARGASVRVMPIEHVRPPIGALDASNPVRQTVLVSPEIDLAFLRRGPDRNLPAPGSARAVPTAESEELSGDWTREKAPWES